MLALGNLGQGAKCQVQDSRANNCAGKTLRPSRSVANIRMGNPVISATGSRDCRCDPRASTCALARRTTAWGLQADYSSHQLRIFRVVKKTSLITPPREDCCSGRTSSRTGRRSTSGRNPTGIGKRERTWASWIPTQIARETGIRNGEMAGSLSPNAKSIQSSSLASPLTILASLISWPLRSLSSKMLGPFPNRKSP